MPQFSTELASLIARRHGTIRHSELLADGFSPAVIRRLITSGVLAAPSQAGVPELVRQHPVRLPDGSVVHPDGALPDLRWAVEVDHVTWHGGRFDAQYDKSRDRKARRAGWTVERITDSELAADFSGAIAELVEMYHHHLSRLAA